ncbi:hypothetical protein P7C70_g4299, partial [Phenoliferia sp. Uapishka_3]
MVSVESLRARHDAVLAMFNSEERELVVRECQQHALRDLLPLLEEELALQEVEVIRARLFLEDQVTVFRFCRRARFSVPAALKLLHATLTWRLTSSLWTLSPASVSPLYLTHPLFFFHPSLADRFGRPCAILNLRHVSRTEGGELNALKEFVRLGWEIGRRWLTDLSKECKDGEAKLQIVLIVDLEGAGMSNLEVELLPFFMDLLKNHFPGMVGAIFVLNYGWMYAGMWQLAKRILPHTALERILFPSKSELLQFFDEEHLLVGTHFARFLFCFSAFTTCNSAEHGGKVAYEYTPSNPILTTYGRPFPPASTSAYPSPLPSPTGSSEPPSRIQSSSSVDELFHSTPNTPSISRPSTPGLFRRPSGLIMTTVTPGRSPASASTERGFFGGWRRPRADTAESVVRRVTSFADLQDHLAETQAAIESDSSGEDEEDAEIERERREEMLSQDESARAYAKQVAEGTPEDGLGIDVGEELEMEGEEGGMRSGPTSAGTSNFSSRAASRATSRDVSRATSREGSPSRRRDGETFSSRAVRFSGTNHVSPYNTANPYYGYPAFVPPSTLDPTGVPRPHFHRRRKRDLVRTLTYLAVLRFLALHRQIKWQLSAILNAVLRLTGLRKLPWAEKEKARTAPKVRWGEPTSPTMIRAGSVGTTSQQTGSNPRQMVDARIAWILLIVILLKTASVRKALKTALVEMPSKVVSPRLVDLLVSRSGWVAGRRKRDVVRGLLGHPKFLSGSR